MTEIYKIAEKFTKTPGGRFKRHGPFSGEEFRDNVLCGLLQEAVESGKTLTVELDGTAGYGSSFLEEAFGGLIRRGLFSKESVKRHLKLSALDPLYETYRISANRYIENAQLQKGVKVKSGPAPIAASGLSP